MKNLFLLCMAILFFGCQQTLTTPQKQALGELSITIDGGRKQVRAAFVKNALRPQGLLAENNLEFTAQTLQVINTTDKRFFNAQFSIKNKTGSTINNLSLVALVRPVNQAQTAIRDVQNFNGVSLNTFAQAIKPTNGMSSSTQVNPNLADLTLYSETEISSLEASAGSALGTGFLLPYGFIARSATGGRGIVANNVDPSGTVNIGLDVPNSNDPSGGASSSAYRFTMSFLVFENPDAQSRVVQSLEEQSSAGNTAVTARDDRSNWFCCHLRK